MDLNKLLETLEWIGEYIEHGPLHFHFTGAAKVLYTKLVEVTEQLRASLKDGPAASVGPRTLILAGSQEAEFLASLSKAIADQVDGDAMEIPPPEFTSGFDAGIDFALKGLTYSNQIGKFDARKNFRLQFPKSPTIGAVREEGAGPKFDAWFKDCGLDADYCHSAREGWMACLSNGYKEMISASAEPHQRATKRVIEIAKIAGEIAGIADGAANILEDDREAADFISDTAKHLRKIQALARALYASEQENPHS